MVGEPRAVSVVIPTHGRPDYLAQALASVLDQDLPPREVIVVSDIGDDATRELCRRLSGDELPIRLLVREGGAPGASASRNLGWKAVEHDVVAFLDDDDLWEPAFLRQATASLTGADAVLAWLMMFRGDSRTPGPRMPAGVTAPEVIAENPGMTGSNMVVRRAALERLAGFDEDLPVKNDGDLLYRFLREGFTYRVVEEFLVLQRKHGDGQLTGRTEFRAAGLERYMRKHVGEMTRGDRRAMLLAIHRIRFHAASEPRSKLRHLLAGAWYSSPRSVLRSLAGRRSRSYWLTTGFSEQEPSARS